MRLVDYIISLSKDGKSIIYEPIVRCRDCKHYEEIDTMFGFDSTCCYWAEGPEVAPDEYCSRGEHK